MNTKRFALVGGVVLVAVMALGLMVALLSKSSAIPAMAQVTPPNGYSGITVSGIGSVAVKPDVVRLTIGVSERAATVGDAQKLVSTKAIAITDALKKAGVKAEDIQTSGYNIFPEYRYENNQPPILTGYSVSNQFDVVIRDVDGAGKVIDAASAAGANQISGISFSVENNAKVLEQARLAAMEDARKTADQLATGGKVQVGSVVRVLEQSQNVAPKVANFAEARSAVAASGAGTTIEAGQFKVVVNVEVTFAIK